MGDCEYCVCVHLRESRGEIVKISCYMPKTSESIELPWSRVYTTRCPLYGWFPTRS